MKLLENKKEKMTFSVLMFLSSNLALAASGGDLSSSITEISARLVGVGNAIGVLAIVVACIAHKFKPYEAKATIIGVGVLMVIMNAANSIKDILVR